jgi:hypothetical protein
LRHLVRRRGWVRHMGGMTHGAQVKRVVCGCGQRTMRGCERHMVRRWSQCMVRGLVQRGAQRVWVGAVHGTRGLRVRAVYGTQRVDTRVHMPCGVHGVWYAVASMGVEEM